MGIPTGPPHREASDTAHAVQRPPEARGRAADQALKGRYNSADSDLPPFGQRTQCGCDTTASLARELGQWRLPEESPEILLRAELWQNMERRAPSFMHRVAGSATEFDLSETCSQSVLQSTALYRQWANASPAEAILIGDLAGFSGVIMMGLCRGPDVLNE